MDEDRNYSFNNSEDILYRYKAIVEDLNKVIDGQKDINDVSSGNALINYLNPQLLSSYSEHNLFYLN